jgi:uncharacterized protein YjbI with pentapeptide repeats
VGIKSTAFENCKLVGVTFNQDSLQPFLTSFDFENSKLSSCTFANLKLDNVSFKECLIDEGLFESCSLKKSDFSNSEFQRTAITRCNLSGADFRNTTGANIDLRENRTEKTKFSYANAGELLFPFGIILD